MILSFSCLTSQPIDEVGIGRYICIKYNVINHEEKDKLSKADRRDKSYQKWTENLKEERFLVSPKTTPRVFLWKVSFL